MFFVITVSMLLCASHSHATSIKRTEIATIPEGFVEGSIVLSSDGKHCGFVVESSGSQRIVCDGIESQEFEAVSKPIFSPNGKLFFWARKNGRIVLSADGQILPTSLAGGGSIVFGDDGARWAAFGAEQEKQDGDKINAGSIVMFVDGVEIGKYTDISYPDFSDDGTHYAFLTLDEDERMSLVIDGKVSTIFDKPEVDCSFIMRAWVRGPHVYFLSSVHYLKNGEIIALVRDANGWTVYKEGKALKSYPQNVWGGRGYSVMFFDGFDDAESIHGRSLVVAENAPVAAWWERPSGKDSLWRVVVDGKPVDSNTCQNIWSERLPVLSNDGKRIAYAADSAAAEDKKKDIFIYVDEEKYGPYANVWGIRFSDDAKHFAYAASDGEMWTYYLDGKPFTQKYSSVYPPVFSADGKHIAWKAVKDEKKVLAVNGEVVYTAGETVWGPDIQNSGVTSWIIREEDKVIKITIILQ
jgi:hypothetical protein